MKVYFKFPRGIEGKDYPKGEHELSDSLKDHWFFKALVACGDLEVKEAAPVVELAPIAEEIAEIAPPKGSKKKQKE